MSVNPAGDPEMVRMAFRLATAYARREPSLLDEFESAALVALVEAAAKFDPLRGADFPRHAAWTIRHALVDCHRAWMPRGYRLPADRRRNGAVPVTVSLASAAVGRTTSDDPASIGDTIPAAGDPVGAAAESHDDVERYARMTPTPHARFLRAMYGGERTGAVLATGRELGYRPSRSSGLYREAIDILRRKLGVQAS